MLEKVLMLCESRTDCFINIDTFVQKMCSAGLSSFSSHHKELGLFDIKHFETASKDTFKM